jgi:hypothetical protein
MWLISWMCQIVSDTVNTNFDEMVVFNLMRKLRLFSAWFWGVKCLRGLKSCVRGAKGGLASAI